MVPCSDPVSNTRPILGVKDDKVHLRLLPGVNDIIVPLKLIT